MDGRVQQKLQLILDNPEIHQEKVEEESTDNVLTTILGWMGREQLTAYNTTRQLGNTQKTGEALLALAVGEHDPRVETVYAPVYTTVTFKQQLRKHSEGPWGDRYRHMSLLLNTKIWLPIAADIINLAGIDVEEDRTHIQIRQLRGTEPSVLKTTATFDRDGINNFVRAGKENKPLEHLIAHLHDASQFFNDQENRPVPLS